MSTWNRLDLQTTKDLNRLLCPKFSPITVREFRDEVGTVIGEILGHSHWLRT